MAFNINELILDRVRSATSHDLSTGEMLLRLTQLEDPTLNCTAESEEVVDAIGAVITTLYRAKKATFSATNSLMSLDLAAAQYGTKKEIASTSNKIEVPTYEIITIPADATEVKLAHKPVKDSVSYIYSIIKGETGTGYKAGSSASATEFVIAEDGAITLPTGLTGKIYVDYIYEADGEEKNGANRVRNMAANFPEACSLKIYAIFKDKCNENLVYSGVIIAPKAKLNPESIELALTSTGKHGFEFTFMKDYCDEDGELFSIIVAE